MKLFQNISDFVTRSVCSVESKKSSQMDTYSQEEHTIQDGMCLRMVIVILSVGAVISVTEMIITIIINGI